MTRKASRLVAVIVYVAMLGWSLSVVLDTSSHRSINVLCSSIEEVCRQWAGGFTETTGIDVRMVRMSTGEALTRLSRADGLGDFDVWHGGPAESYELAKWRGLLDPYQPVDAEEVPSPFRDPEGYWHGVYLGILGFCSNEAVLERQGIPVPQHWDDLLDPRLQGLVSAPHPVSSGTGYNLLWTTMVCLDDLDATLDYLEALDHNVLQYTHSGMAPSRVAGRGEAAVGVGFTQHCLDREREGFTNLVVSYPEGGVGYEVGSVALLSQARDPAAARSYIDYAVSRAAQSLGNQLPTRGDVSADPRLGSEVPRLYYTAAQAAAAKSDLTQAALDRGLR